MTESPVISAAKETNNLFPVFIKLENLRLLIVGGGDVGLEKLNAVIANSPATKITVVADFISDDIKKLAERNTIELIERRYQSNDLNNNDLVIVAVTINQSA